jgi:hypothetical protein
MDKNSRSSSHMNLGTLKRQMNLLDPTYVDLIEKLKIASECRVS